MTAVYERHARLCMNLPRYGVCDALPHPYPAYLFTHFSLGPSLKNWVCRHPTSGSGRSHLYCFNYAMKSDRRRANHIIEEKSWPNRKITLIIFIKLQPNVIHGLLGVISVRNRIQLVVFFCSSVPVVLFDTPGISRCRSKNVSVESSSLLHHSIYLWFICFPWWSIDELENLHADRTTVCFEP